MVSCMSKKLLSKSLKIYNKFAYMQLHIWPLHVGPITITPELLSSILQMYPQTDHDDKNVHHYANYADHKRTKAQNNKTTISLVGV